jgi:PPK2 family polyphosphate:nucleotide phosphotransferase
VKSSSVRDLLRARGGERNLNLDAIDPENTHGIKQKRALAEAPAAAEYMAEYQERLYAERKRSLLIVLQAMDTGGKDGTLTHAMSGLNPQGVRVVPFKAPTPEEKRHDFLWRIKRGLPGPGEIVIFNRSHYEDVLIARVKELVPAPVIERRYAAINRFEQEVAQRGTTIVKLYLHISRDEQRQRLLNRLADPLKHWKFSENDIKERAYWPDYMAAYQLALARCNPRSAPWYIVPANHKWFRNWAVARLLLETLESLNPQYPRPRLPIARLRAELLAS